MEPALKQRLIGAAVLVALAVIFLPMLIKGPAPESGVSDVSLQLPDAASTGEMQTRELPLLTPSQAPLSGTGGAVGLPGQADDGRLPTVDTTAPSDSGMMPAAVAGGGYAISFGSYATPADAARVVDALRASQLPGYAEPVAGRNGASVHRVRIGPFASRADAEAARLRAAHVRDDVGAQVLALDAGTASASAPATAVTQAPATSSTPRPAAATAPVRQEPLAETWPAPAAVAPAPKPAPPTPTPTPRPAESVAAPAKPAPAAPAVSAPAAADVGFAVQLGAFSNADEATRLRDRVRGLGMGAFTQQVQTDKGPLVRVLAGPVGSRAEAEQLKSQVAARTGISGMVRAHP